MKEVKNHLSYFTTEESNKRCRNIRSVFDFSHHLLLCFMLAISLFLFRPYNIANSDVIPKIIYLFTHKLEFFCFFPTNKTVIL